MKYQVTLHENSTLRYIVDAENEDEAEEKAMDMDASEGLLVDGSVEIIETELLDDEPGNSISSKDEGDI